MFSTITTVIDYIHHSMSQHLTVQYKAAAWVAYPCQPSNEDILAGRDIKKKTVQTLPSPSMSNMCLVKGHADV